MNRTVCLIGIAVTLTGCSGTWPQDAARDAATEKTCDYYARCGQIQEGERYKDRDDCEIAQRAYWNDAWPDEQCDNKIRNEDMDTCLKAIEITDCNNGLDFLNTIVNKCGRDKVCQGP